MVSGISGWDVPLFLGLDMRTVDVMVEEGMGEDRVEHRFSLHSSQEA